MHIGLKNILYRAIRQFRFKHTLGKSLTKSKNSISILAYHAVVKNQLPIHDWCFLDDKSFRKQIIYLKNNFNVIQLSQAVTLLEKGSIDKPTAVITFDDGFQNNYEVAFPILKEFDMPATIFLSTSFIDTQGTLWFCKLNRALEITGRTVLRWNEQIYRTGTTAEKGVTSWQIQSELKQLTHSLLMRELHNIITKLGQDPSSPIERTSPFAILNSRSIYKMMESNLIEFGAHTDSHAILSKLQKEQKRKEIQNSIIKTAEIVGKPCILFSFPNGRTYDYDGESLDILKSEGIRACLTMNSGPNDHSTPLMELNRYGIMGDVPLGGFESLLNYFIGRFRSPRQ